MPRFVILEHDHPVLHWDLMLEAGDVLQTWRLAMPPCLGVPIEATALGDHRRAYLDYEGPVSGNRGNVKRWDAGKFEESFDSTAENRRLMFQGQQIKGVARVHHVGGDRWVFCWEKP